MKTTWALFILIFSSQLALATTYLCTNDNDVQTGYRILLKEKQPQIVPFYTHKKQKFDGYTWDIQPQSLIRSKSTIAFKASLYVYGMRSDMHAILLNTKNPKSNLRIKIYDIQSPLEQINATCRVPKI